MIPARPSCWVVISSVSEPGSQLHQLELVLSSPLLSSPPVSVRKQYSIGQGKAGTDRHSQRRPRFLVPRLRRERERERERGSSRAQWCPTPAATTPSYLRTSPPTPVRPSFFAQQHGIESVYCCCTYVHTYGPVRAFTVLFTSSQKEGRKEGRMSKEKGTRPKTVKPQLWPDLGIPNGSSSLLKVMIE